MQEVFKKIIMQLGIRAEKSEKKEMDAEHFEYAQMYKGERIAFGDAIEIVKQEAEQFGTDTNVGSNGWIPVEEELPKTDEYILLSFSNFSTPLVGRYEGDEEKGGAFYIGDDDETCVSQNMYVNAWQPLPEPYLPVSNDSTDAGTRYEKSAWRDLILRNFMRGSDA